MGNRFNPEPTSKNSNGGYDLGSCSGGRPASLPVQEYTSMPEDPRACVWYSVVHFAAVLP